MMYYLIIKLFILNFVLKGKEIKNKLKKEFLISLNLQHNYPGSDVNFPLVLFLYGAVERGDDIRLVENHDTLKMVNNG